MSSVKSNALVVLKAELVDRWMLVAIPVLIGLLTACNSTLPDLLAVPEVLIILWIVPCVILLVISVRIIKASSTDKGQFSSYIIASGYSRMDIFNSGIICLVCMLPFFFIVCFGLVYSSGHLYESVLQGVMLTSMIVTAAMIISVLCYSFNKRRTLIAVGSIAVLVMMPLGYIAFMVFTSGGPQESYALMSVAYAAICCPILYVWGRRLASKYDY